MHAITLSWTASLSPNIAGYYLYSGTHSGVYTTRRDVGNQTSIDVPNLIEGTTYYFTVSAYGTDGNESVAASEFSYMPNPPLLLNLSTRAYVQNGDRILIAGFIVGGTGRKKMVVRALGRSLFFSNVKDALLDPMLDVYGANGLIASNDNWITGDTTLLTNLRLAPFFNEESAAIVTLGPGSYSALVSGKGGTSGMALLEVYDAGPADD
jgi:hypothetical protein